MNQVDQLIAHFAQKIVDEVRASALPLAYATTAFGVAAKILAVELSINVPLGDCEAWAEKELNDGFSWNVTLSEDNLQPITVSPEKVLPLMQAIERRYSTKLP